MNSQIAGKQLTDLLDKYAKFGAADSEGWHAVDRIEEAAEEGKPFPFVPRSADDPLYDILPFNPFQLYQSVEGWEAVSQVLVDAAHVYWRLLINERLGVTFAADGTNAIPNALSALEEATAELYALAGESVGSGRYAHLDAAIACLKQHLQEIE